MSMTLIATATVTGSPADISLTSIPQTYTDLQILISAVPRTTASPNALGLGFNGYSSTSNAIRALRASGSGVSSFTDTSPIAGDLQQITNTYNSITVYIPNYTTSGVKSFSSDSVTENNSTTAWLSIRAGAFTNAAAITSIQFGDFSAGGGLGVGSQVWLYGILKGSGGATVS
jgi:hypothetical protein